MKPHLPRVQQVYVQIDTSIQLGPLVTINHQLTAFTDQGVRDHVEAYLGCGVPGCVRVHGAHGEEHANAAAQIIDSDGKVVPGRFSFGGHEQPPGMYAEVLFADTARRLDHLTERMAAAILGPPPMHKCALLWCGITVSRKILSYPAKFCSSNCSEASHKVDVSVKRLADFKHRAGSRSYDGNPDVDRGLAGEVAWAESMHRQECETIKRSWQALRHESPVGDDRFFALLDDEDA